MADPRRVLVVVAHPDDEMQISGTIALQARAGLEVTIAVACNGNLGGLPGATIEERAAARQREMQAACELLGARLEWLGYGDDNFMARFYQDYPATEMAFRNLCRRVDPELMIVPALDDYHQHHRAVAELALNATINASNPAIVSEEPPSSMVPYALHLPPVGPMPFAPALYVDITETFKIKMAALTCHASQHGYIQSHHRTDIFKQVEAAALIHGTACGVTYAEALGLCLRFNRPATIQRLAGLFPGGKEA